MPAPTNAAGWPAQFTPPTVAPSEVERLREELNKLLVEWEGEIKALSGGFGPNDWEAGNRSGFKSCAADVRRILARAALAPAKQEG
jgi:hypothetical protein